jgi:hypothetical protein
MDRQTWNAAELETLNPIIRAWFRVLPLFLVLVWQFSSLRLALNLALLFLIIVLLGYMVMMFLFQLQPDIEPAEFN